MQCYVYRSNRKPGSFLFIPEKDEFGRVPPTLLKIFGEPQFSFDFALTPERPLMIKTAAGAVLRVMQENGLYLELPPGEDKSAD